MTMTGRLRRRLALEHAVSTPDGAGGSSIAWLEMAQVWAVLMPQGGAEHEDYGRIDSRSGYRIRVRFRSDVRPEMRFRLGARLFDIEAVYDPYETRRFLDCLCRERVY